MLCHAQFQGRSMNDPIEVKTFVKFEVREQLHYFNHLNDYLTQVDERSNMDNLVKCIGYTAPDIRWKSMKNVYHMYVLGPMPTFKEVV